MKGNATKRLGALLALLVAMQVFVVPAAQAATVGTASIKAAQRTVLAGTTDQPFEITVTNGSLIERQGAVNYVQVIPPTLDGYTISSVTAPSGWTGRIKNGVAIFETSSTDPSVLILPSQSKVFTVTGNVPRPATDDASPWSVSTSAAKGAQLASAAEAGAGALRTTARVLNVRSVSLTGSALVTDGTVTSGQTATLQAVVQNAGSAPLAVTPALTGLGDATFTGGATQTIPATSDGIFTWDVTFGSAGTVTPSVDASATGADGLAASGSAITIQTPVSLTYKNDTLSPRDLVPGQSYTFSLALDKAGEVAADLTSASLGLGVLSTSLAAPVTLAGGNDSKTLTFNALAVALPDGAYTPTLTVSGTDSNGASFTATPAIGNGVTVDSTLPVVAPTLTPPASQVSSEDPAATNGATVTFGGFVYLADGTTKCTNCSIDSAYLRQFAGTTALANIPVTVSLSNTGALSGSYNGNYDPAATRTELVVVAKKVNGTLGSGQSAPVDVDNIAPSIVGARTGGTTSDKRLVTVELSEGIAGGQAGMSATDWTVDNAAVQSATITPDAKIVELRLTQDLQQDARPRVAYAPTPVSQAKDRVGKTLTDQAVQAVDGIVPLEPTITKIAGATAQGGEFFTNDSTPDFEITDVAAGQTVTLYEDTNLNNNFDPGTDAPIGEATVQSGNTAVINGDLGTNNRTVKIFGRTEDGSGNLGPVSTDTLTLDFTPVTTVAATLAGDTVNVTFSEPLGAGRDFAADWFVYGIDVNGDYRRFPAETVGGTGATRAVTVDHPDFAGNVSQIEYMFTGETPTDRYRDRAGNDVADFQSPVS